MLPNLLVEGIRRAIEASPAMKIYVCNVATQHGETDGFSVSDHYRDAEGAPQGQPVRLRACEQQHGGRAAGGVALRAGEDRRADADGARVVKADVVDEENRYRHDSKKLADALIRLYYERNAAAGAGAGTGRLKRSTPQEAGVG